jgi:hypothetical protein
MDDPDPLARQRGPLRGRLDALRGHVVARRQPGEQLAGAAADVERAGAGAGAGGQRQPGDRGVDRGLGERVGECDATVGDRGDRGAV